jgi:hypothetical protein
MLACVLLGCIWVVMGCVWVVLGCVWVVLGCVWVQLFSGMPGWVVLCLDWAGLVLGCF